MLSLYASYGRAAEKFLRGTVDPEGRAQQGKWTFCLTQEAISDWVRRHRTGTQVLEKSIRWEFGLRNRQENYLVGQREARGYWVF